MIDELDSRKVIRSDELDYRTTLKRKLETCLTFFDTIHLPMFVNSLEVSLKFDVPGLPLKTEIEQIKKEMRIAKKEFKAKKIRELKQKYGIDAFGNAKQVFLKVDVEFGYWKTYLSALIELMAIHGLLMEPRGYVEEGMELKTTLEENKN